MIAQTWNPIPLEGEAGESQIERHPVFIVRHCLKTRTREKFLRKREKEGGRERERERETDTHTHMSIIHI